MIGGTAVGSASGQILMNGPGAAQAIISAPLTLRSPAARNEAFIEVTEGNTLTISNAISTAGAVVVRKRGLGIATLSGNNAATLASPIAIEEGVLRAQSNTALGNTAVTTVVSGATLELAGGLAIASEPLTLNGTGVNNTGALRLAADAVADTTLGTAVTLGSAATVNIIPAAPRKLTLNATLSGAFTLTKIGAGTLELGGSAANTGSVTVAEGTANLAKTAAVAVAGTLTIGSDLGGDNAQQAVVTGVAGQSATVVIASTGLLNLNGIAFTATALTMSVGTSASADVINSNATPATLTMGGGITQNIAASTNANADGSAPPARIGSDVSPNLTLALGATGRTITTAIRTNVAGLATDTSLLLPSLDGLRINAAINATGTATPVITSAGTGRLALAGVGIGFTAANVLTVGATSIVAIRNANALDGAAGLAISITAGGTLEYDVAGALSAETASKNLTLNGGGTVDNVAGGFTTALGLGALRVAQGNPILTGSVTAATATNIYVPNVTSTLTFTGAFSSTLAAIVQVVGPGTAEFQNTVSAAAAVATFQANGSTIRLAGAGIVSTNIGTVNIVNGGTFHIANGAAAGNRVIDAAAITLNGGRLLYESGAGTNAETLGNVAVGAFANIIESKTNGGTSTLTLGTITYAAGSSLRFIGTGTNLGAAGNVITSTSALNNASNIIPRSTVTSSAGVLDLAAQAGGAGTAIIPFASYVAGPLSGATAGQVVLITANDAAAPAVALGGVLIRGTGITVSGAGTLNTAMLASDGTGTNTISGITLNSGAETFVAVDDGNSLDIQGIVAGAASALTKAGRGDLKLSGTAGVNTYAGGTIVGEGTVTVAKSGGLGTGTVSLTGGGYNTTGNTTAGITNTAIIVDGGGTGIDVGNAGLTITAFHGLGGVNGSLQSINGNNTWGTGATAIALGSVTAVRVGSGSLTLSSTITGAANNNLVKFGPGNLILAGTASNTYSGSTEVLEGDLTLAKVTAATPVAIPGASLVVNPSSNVNVTTGIDGQIAAATALRMLQGSSLNLNGRATSVALIVMCATIDTGGGVLTLTGAGSDVLVNDSANSSVINGVLSLSGATHSFVVADGSNAADLLINAAIVGGGASAGVITKEGLGTLVLTNVNTYAGSTIVNRGTLEIRNGLSLGAIDPTPPILDPVQAPLTTSNATFVSPNATLRLNSAGGAAVAVAGEVLQLNASTVGTINGGHTLESTTGNNSWQGPLQLVNPAAGGLVNIDVSGGSLRLNGQGMHLLTSATALPTIVGIAKTGLGRLELGSDANVYQGATQILQGTLWVDGVTHPASIVTVTSGTTLGGTGTIGGMVVVNPGGTLSPGHSPGILGTGSLAMAAGSTYFVEIFGTTVGTQYDQTAVTGSVTLENATLTINSTGLATGPGQAFVIISNDGTDPVVGIFSGFAEGATVTLNGNSSYTITYAGGDGNDVVILNSTTVSITATSADKPEGNTGTTPATSFTFTVSRSGTTATDVSWTLNHVSTTAADFTGPTSGTVNFTGAETTETITISVVGDLTVEPNEAFTVTLTARRAALSSATPLPMARSRTTTRAM